MQIIQRIATFLQNFFTVIGSVVSFSVIFYCGMAFIDQHSGKAIASIAHYSHTEKEAAEKRIRRQTGICSAVFGIFCMLLGIGITALNFACTGILGGIATIALCIFAIILFFDF